MDFSRSSIRPFYYYISVDFQLRYSSGFHHFCAHVGYYAFCQVGVRTRSRANSSEKRADDFTASRIEKLALSITGRQVRPSGWRRRVVGRSAVLLMRTLRGRRRRKPRRVRVAEVSQQ